MLRVLLCHFSVFIVAFVLETEPKGVGSWFLRLVACAKLCTPLQARKWNPGQAMALKGLPENLGLVSASSPPPPKAPSLQDSTTAWRVRGLWRTYRFKPYPTLLVTSPRTQDQG